MNLSFIIPLYNAENYLVQCLDSIFNQDLDENDFEVIVIDDGSTDNSYLKAKEFAKNKGSINVYHQENKGVSATRNKGIELAKGKYLWFIDSDDYIIFNTANQLIKCAEKYHLDILEFKMIRTESRMLNNTLNEAPAVSKIKVLDGKDYVSSKSFNDSCCVYLFRRQFILNTKVRFIEGKIMEDMIFTAEIIPKSQKIAYFPLDVYRYIINPNSIWTNKKSQSFRKSIEDFIFMTKKFTHLIKDYEINNIDTTVIKSKQQNMLFNILKRLFISDYSLYELQNIIKDLKNNNLYPMQKHKGKGFLRKYEILIFNKKYLFLFEVFMYRLFKGPIDNYIIKRYQKKKEKEVMQLR